RQLLTEAMVLSILGGAAGLVIAGLLLRVLNQWASPYGHVAVRADGRRYLGALILSLVSALLLGMVPARLASQSRLLQAMKRDAAAVNVPLEKQKAMLEAVQRIPGVTTAGTVNRVPFTGGLRGVPIFPPGTTEFNLNNSVLAPYVYTMSPGYLEAAGTRLLSG